MRHIPDILDTLAQLSNDEVPTPPKLARAMLDILPDEVWSKPDFVWLDPFCKSGVFLREVAARLLKGLSDQLPDFVERREHIYRYMLFGTSITEMTGHISRRSLYCSRDASGEHSVVRFDTESGNLPFVPAEHECERGRCRVCGAPEDLERGSRRENYAYSFIHGAYPTKELADMKFDVIVGNPPYQMGDGGGGGGASANPVYQLFVEQAIALNPRYILMITPSRWFAGGKGLDDFRSKMLQDRRMEVLVDHPQLYDVFPGVKIRGGVSYFLWSRAHNGPCLVSTKIGDVTVDPPVQRDLREFDVLVRRSEAAAILRRIRKYRKDGEPEPTLAEKVSARRPFGLARASHHDLSRA